MSLDASSDCTGPSPAAPAASFWESRTAQLILPLLAYKAFILWVVLASANLLPNTFNLEGYQANFHWPSDKKPGLAERFMTWDGEHYLYLSQEGYHAESPSAAFYPLWPGLIYVTSKLFPHQRLLIALFLSNVFSLAAWLLFHRLVDVEHGEELAGWATVFLIAFPGSLFFQFPYSESLFLLLVMIFFWAMKRDDHRWLAIAGFLLPLTRAVGLFCAAPLAVHYWRQGRRWRDYWPLLAIGSGWIAYLTVMGTATGNPFEGFAAQQYYAAGASITKLLDPVGFLNSLFTTLQLHGFLDSFFDRLFFVCFVAALVPLYRLGKVYFACALAIGFIPAITNSFMSYTRFLAVVFPLFIATAQHFAVAERRYWRFILVAVLFAIQIIFLLRHVNFHWAG